MTDEGIEQILRMADSRECKMSAVHVYVCVCVGECAQYALEDADAQCAVCTQRGSCSVSHKSFRLAFLFVLRQQLQTEMQSSLYFVTVSV